MDCIKVFCRCLEIGLNAAASVESQNSFSVRLKQVRSRDELGESESDLMLEEAGARPRVPSPSKRSRDPMPIGMPMRDMTNTTQPQKVDRRYSL
jgi:hypothetical protein